MSWFRHQYAIGSQDNYNHIHYRNSSKLLPISDLIVAVAVDNVVQAVSVVDRILVAPVRPDPCQRPPRRKKKKYGFYR